MNARDGHHERSIAQAQAPRGLAGGIGKRRPFDSLEQEVFLNLLRTGDHLLCDFVRLFKQHGLSMSLYNALRIVQGAGSEGIPVRTIAERMIVREPDISRLVDGLERRNLCERRRSTSDRRVVRVFCTEAGGALLETLHEPVLALHGRQLGHIPRDKLRQINELLNELRAEAG